MNEQMTISSTVTAWLRSNKTNYVSLKILVQNINMFLMKASAQYSFEEFFFVRLGIVKEHTFKVF